MISNAKSVFLAINASLHWLNNVRGMYLVQVSLLLIGQEGLGNFIRYRLLLQIGWRNVQYATNIMKPMQTHIYCKKCVNGSVYSEGHLKLLKTRRDAYSGLDLLIHVIKTQSSL
jgi:hypothetical protein